MSHHKIAVPAEFFPDAKLQRYATHKADWLVERMRERFALRLDWSDSSIDALEIVGRDPQTVRSSGRS